jgi:hypothetical protein
MRKASVAWDAASMDASLIVGSWQITDLYPPALAVRHGDGL